jgi:LysR family hydrogen peroxide-inducible transcriptional activator
MIWRHSTPMAKQLVQVSEAVRRSADSMREQYIAR